MRTADAVNGHTIFNDAVSLDRTHAWTGAHAAATGGTGTLHETHEDERSDSGENQSNSGTMERSAVVEDSAAYVPTGATVQTVACCQMR